jgi:hypothetical protein
METDEDELLAKLFFKSSRPSSGTPPWTNSTTNPSSDCFRTRQTLSTKTTMR